MSHPIQSPDNLSAVESQLGTVLVLIHRVLPRLNDPACQAEVQSTLSKVAALIDSARTTYSGGGNKPPPLGAQPVATAVAPEIAAVIAAAVSAVLDRPYRLVSVQQVTVPVVPHLNVWAVEGRTQIFMSHKVR